MSATSTSATSGRCRPTLAICSRVRQGARARDEHRPVQDRAARPVPGRCPPLTKTSGQPFTPSSKRHRQLEEGGEVAIDAPLTMPEGETRMNDMTPIEDHAQGLGNRPGGPLVPGLRRLCDPEGGAAHAAADRRRSGEHGVRQRHRLLQPVPLLHGKLRLPHDPRPRAGLCHRHQARQSGARRVAGDRRRRWHVDRRQPHDARAAPQREHARSCCSTTRSTA
jgi:hypothetical protein